MPHADRRGGQVEVLSPCTSPVAKATETDCLPFPLINAQPQYTVLVVFTLVGVEKRLGTRRTHTQKTAANQCRNPRLLSSIRLGRSANPASASSPAGRTARDKLTVPKPMAWRPYENLIDGELDNQTAGKVTGWMQFFRNGQEPLRVTFDLDGDFHDDIRGTKIRLSNPQPSDRYEGKGTYMEGFSEVQSGTVGDMTGGRSLGPWTEQLARQLMERNELAWDEMEIHGEERERQRKKFSDRYRQHIAAGDLYYPYVEYPYLEWYSDNGRVVLELDPSQLEIVEKAPTKAKTAAETYRAGKKRDDAMVSFIHGLLKNLSEENRKQGGDGNVTGIVVN